VSGTGLNEEVFAVGFSPTDEAVVAEETAVVAVAVDRVAAVVIGAVVTVVVAGNGDDVWEQ
jgi:hypothetical protein